MCLYCCISIPTDAISWVLGGLSSAGSVGLDGNYYQVITIFGKEGRNNMGCVELGRGT